MFADVIMERMKVRQEAQEAKSRVGEEKQEAVKTAEDTAEFTAQLDNGDHKDTESKASSQGKGELNAQYFVNSCHFSYSIS